MIKPSKDGKKLWFIPPEKVPVQELEFDLVYAHTCPKCNNLVQALFMTDKKINIKPWEEIFTKVLDSDGKYKRIIPGRSDKFRSRYTTQVIGRNGLISAQLIRFAEHFERREDVVNGNVCSFMSISTTIPEYRVYDMLLAHGMNPSQYKLKDTDYPDVKESLMKSYSGQDQYAFVDAVGDGPEMVCIHRNAYMWFMNEAAGRFCKPYIPPVSGY